MLTHEAIVDSLWDSSIQKLLLKRFPAATPEDLEKAHAYVYGGCIIQDMGYYPFSKSFSSISPVQAMKNSGDLSRSASHDRLDIAVQLRRSSRAKTLTARGHMTA